MSDFSWSPAEKKIARDAYETALQAAGAKIIAEFKRRAAAVTVLSDIWAIEEFARAQRRELSEIFDYRYSRLLLTFAWAIREGHLDEATLAALSDDKRKFIRSISNASER